MKWWNLRLRYITIQKIRIVYNQGYKHDLWVYDLKEEKDGSYSWESFGDDKIIDLDPDNVASISVIKTKKSWKVYEKAGIVTDQFKPKVIDREKFAPYRKYYDTTSVKDEIQIVIKETKIVTKEIIKTPEIVKKQKELYKEAHSDRAKVVESIYITMTTPEEVVGLRQEILQLERRIAKLKGKA